MILQPSFLFKVRKTRNCLQRSLIEAACEDCHLQTKAFAAAVTDGVALSDFPTLASQTAGVLWPQCTHHSHSRRSAFSLPQRHHSCLGWAQHLHHTSERCPTGTNSCAQIKRHTLSAKRTSGHASDLFQLCRIMHVKFAYYRPATSARHNTIRNSWPPYCIAKHKMNIKSAPHPSHRQLNWHQLHAKLPTYQTANLNMTSHLDKIDTNWESH